MREYERIHSALGYPGLEDDEVEWAERAYQDAVTKYGRSFRGPYGWAAEALGKDRASIADVEARGLRAHEGPLPSVEPRCALERQKPDLSQRNLPLYFRPVTLAFGAFLCGTAAAPKARVTGLKEEAVSAILSAPDQATRYGRRDAALIVTLYATACRIGELLAMRVSHLHLNGRHPHASVVGKGGKARVVFLPDGAVDHMRAYLREFHGDRPDPEAFVFYSRNHPPGQRRLSQDAVSKMLRKHATDAHGRCADVPLDVTAHRFRHARATHWLEGGMNVAQISMLLGHSTIQTTMAYLDVTLAAEEQAMQALVRSPQEKRWKGADARLTVACGLEGP